MNKENFVTYEQAVRLKRLGFNYLCLFNYDSNGNYVPNSIVGDGVEGVTTFDLLSSFNLDESKRVDCPTLSQVQKWLREVKNTIVLSTCNLDYKNGHFWYWFIDKIFNVDDSEFSYKTYEEALSAGITECIKLLEKEEHV